MFDYINYTNQFAAPTTFGGTGDIAMNTAIMNSAFSNPTGIMDNYNMDFMSSMFQFPNFDFSKLFHSTKTSHKPNISNLASNMKEAMAELRKRAKAAGIKDFSITSGFRSYQEQKDLFRTKRKGLAAPPKTSMHTKGLAIDINASPDDLKKLGKIWSEMGYTWGGNWQQNTENWHFDLRANTQKA